jgi:Flp pilus assembly protein TadD
MRALVYAKQNDLDKGIADLSELIRLRPDDAHAYLDRGTLYFKKGDKVKADADRDRAKELDPTFVERLDKERKH